MSLSARVTQSLEVHHRLLQASRDVLGLDGRTPGDGIHLLEPTREAAVLLCEQASRLLSDLRHFTSSMRHEMDGGAFEKFKTSVTARTKAETCEEMMRSLRSDCGLLQTIISE